MKKTVLLAMLLFIGLQAAHPQSGQLASPFSNSVFPAQIFTGAMTGQPIQLNGLVVPSTVGSSFASGTITLTGSSITTVTFSLQGSSDNGATFYPLPISAVATPGTTSTTVTAISNGLYQVTLAGLTHVRFVTSGTFTATSVSLTLTASPNAQVSRSGSSSSGAVASVFGRTGAVVAALGDYSFTQISDSPSAAQVAGAGTLSNPTTGNAATASSVPYIGLTGTVPIWNQPTTGNAATASSSDHIPTTCPAGQYSLGVDINFNAVSCTTAAGGVTFATLGGGTSTGQTFNVGAGSSILPVSGGVIQATTMPASGLSGSLTAAQIAAAGTLSNSIAPVATLVASVPKTNLTGLYVFDSLDFPAGTSSSGTMTILDRSGNRNDCTINVGGSTGVTVVAIGNGKFGLTFASNANNDAICPGIVSPQSFDIVFSQPTPPVQTFTPIVGYSVASPSFTVFTQVKTTDSGAAPFLIGISGTISSATITPGYNVYSVNYGTTYPTTQIFQNGNFQPFLDSGPTGGTHGAALSGGAFEIGGSHSSGFSGGHYCTGCTIAYVAVYSAVRTQAQITQSVPAASAYFAQFGINTAATVAQNTTPIAHHINCSGSSIDAAFGVAGSTANTPCAQMSLGANWSVDVSAVPSSGTLSHTAGNLNDSRYYFNLNSQNVLFMGAPTNDLNESPNFLFSGNTSVQGALNATVLAYQQAMSQSYGAFIAGTMISRTGNASSAAGGGTADAAKDNFNSLLVANGSNYPNFYVANIGAIPMLGADGANSGTIGTIGACPGATTYFQSDCTHPTKAGLTLYGAAIQAVAQAVYGFTPASPNSQSANSYAMTFADRNILSTITATSTWTLPDCTAISGNKLDYRITNLSTFGLTMAGTTTAIYGTITAQTIVGSPTIPAGTSATYLPIPSSPTTGGCSWLRTPTGTVTANGSLGSPHLLFACGPNCVQADGNTSTDGSGAQTVISMSALNYFTGNCTSSGPSPWACGNGSAGIVQVTVGSTTWTINTTAVGSASEIFYNYSIAGSVSCTPGPTNLTSLLHPITTAIVPGVSFTFQLPVAPATNIVCVHFFIMNKN